MKLMIALAFLITLPLAGQASGNRNMHCRSNNAELVFHTVMHGALAIGDYTVFKGQRADLPKEAKGAEGRLSFYNQGRIFQVESAGAEAPLQFRLLAQFFGDEPTVIETGICEEKLR